MRILKGLKVSKDRGIKETIKKKDTYAIYLLIMWREEGIMELDNREEGLIQILIMSTKRIKEIKKNIMINIKNKISIKIKIIRIKTKQIKIMLRKNKIIIEIKKVVTINKIIKIIIKGKIKNNRIKILNSKIKCPIVIMMDIKDVIIMGIIRIVKITINKIK